jgi:CHU_C Type IX secretion signal domain
MIRLLRLWYRKSAGIFLIILSFTQVIYAEETLYIRRVCQDTINNKNNTIYWSFSKDSCKIVGNLTLWGRDGSTSSPFQIIESGINPINFETTHVLAGSNTWEYYIECMLNCGSSNKSFFTKTIRVDNINPSKVEIDSVSVDVKSNQVILSWIPGIETDISRYEIYHTTASGGGYLVGQNNGTFYIDNSSRNPKLNSLSYQVTAVDSCGNRPATGNQHSTIFLSGKTDTCKKEIDLNWTNYRGWKSAFETNVFEYRNDSFVLIGSVPFDSTHFRAKCSRTGSPCRYFVRTTKDNTKTISSSSNLFESIAYYRNELTAPVIKSVDTNPLDNKTSVSFESSGQVKLQVFSFDMGLTYKNTYSGSFVQTLEDPLKNQHLFRVGTNGACAEDSVWGSYSTNIVLKNQGNDLVWNPYFTWNKGVKKYVIYSFTGNYTPTLGEYVVLKEVSDTSETIQSPDNSSRVCYYVEAIEQSGNNRARSNGICLSYSGPKTYWPNAINTETNNNKLLVFGDGISINTPKYTEVYDRWGKMVYKSTDNAFSGYDNNGEKLPGGVYFFIIKVDQYNEEKEFKGTISVVR